MRLFKKSSNVIDLTDLQRKGILQRSKAIANKNKDVVPTKDFVDLSQQKTLQSQQNLSQNSPFDMLSSLASASASENTAFSQPLDVNQLKNKIEDLEYKLDRLIERLSKLEEKN